MPVHEPIDDSLDAFAHRLKGDGDDSGHRERQDEVAAVGQIRADQPDHDDIGSDDADGEDGVNEGPVDDEVEVVQAVPETATAIPSRQRQQRQRREHPAPGNAPQHRVCRRRAAETARQRDEANPAELLALLIARASEPDEKARARRSGPRRRGLLRRACHGDRRAARAERIRDLRVCELELGRGRHPDEPSTSRVPRWGQATTARRQVTVGHEHEQGAQEQREARQPGPVVQPGCNQPARERAGIGTTAVYA